MVETSVVLNNVPVGTMLLDTERRVAYVNRHGVTVHLQGEYYIYISDSGADLLRLEETIFSYFRKDNGNGWRAGWISSDRSYSDEHKVFGEKLAHSFMFVNNIDDVLHEVITCRYEVDCPEYLKDTIHNYLEKFMIGKFASV